MDGVTLHDLKQFNVPKGNVFHALKATDEGYVGFGEAYFSEIESGAIKGWKRHNRFVLNLIVPVGKIRFVIYDNRKDSDTFGQFEEYILSPDGAYKRLTVAAGLWVAFQGIDEKTSLLLDIIPEPHVQNEADSLPLDSIHYKFSL
ncbi:dTDP-4-dehydrorhamnose 3,5-epimerase family protein [Labilibaculum sp. K2S]|uniref:dTDP-4-dehydrorhamnose 3,5-epimerase family protein n=1 Tax=Labilibaculum sp. K2S TaxID=3056386 RepID=UPI0025A3FFA5|nr:dTDP-4-dehydrorhamnose 3,5-epimerase family protein [Labilibaculum sp. K2S]MDM8160287.1 dTDP-4-dehydrorhamnose 3,5-epimerase family protein [Labilibaculum sp. K2S]